MRGDIQHNKIIRSLWANSHTELLCDPLEIDCSLSAWASLYLFICPYFEFILFVCMVITPSVVCFSIWPYCYLYCIVFFPPVFVFFFHSLFIILCFMLCTRSFHPPSTMWWCLHPDAARGIRFTGCVTVCPLTISLYSSTVTWLY